MICYSLTFRSKSNIQSADVNMSMKLPVISQETAYGLRRVNSRILYLTRRCSRIENLNLLIDNVKQIMRGLRNVFIEKVQLFGVKSLSDINKWEIEIYVYWTFIIMKLLRSTILDLIRTHSIRSFVLYLYNPDTFREGNTFYIEHRHIWYN